MPNQRSPRDILIRSMIDNPNNWDRATDLALKELAEWVRSKKRGLLASNDAHSIGYNQALKDIAKSMEEDKC